MENQECPKCGATMIEKFDEKPGPNDTTLAIPTGQYECFRCRREAENAKA